MPHTANATTEPHEGAGVTLDMISAGVAAYEAFDPEHEEPEALVFAILYRALKIREAAKTGVPDELSLQATECQAT